MRILCTLLFLLCFKTILAQPGHYWARESFQKKQDVPTEIKPFVPTGFEVLEIDKADLNMDGAEDMLLLLGVDHTLDSVALSRIFPDTFNLDIRPLIILIRNPDSSLRQVVRNDEVIFHDPVNMGMGDAFSDVTCGKGSFQIEFFYEGGGAHATWDYTYRYSIKLRNWVLRKVVSDEVSNTPTDSGGYDNEKVTTKTQNDFGLIRFSQYKRGDENKH